jgi:hypothetical protein
VGFQEVAAISSPVHEGGQGQPGNGPAGMTSNGGEKAGRLGPLSNRSPGVQGRCILHVGRDRYKAKLSRRTKLGHLENKAKRMPELYLKTRQR